jgi:hypothetical protein
MDGLLTVINILGRTVAALEAALAEAQQRIAELEANEPDRADG